MDKKIRKLLEGLAPGQPINQDELGGCVWCCGMPPGVSYGQAERYLTDHNEHCPWVAARKLLGDEIPIKRAQQREGQ